MGSTCILTDSAVQFSQPGFPGREHVRVLPFHIELNNSIYPEGEGLRTANLPLALYGSACTLLHEIDVEKLVLLLQNLAGQYRDVIAIVTSAELSQASSRIQKAAESVRGLIGVTIIDSMTTSVGLGLLVQNAADAIAHGMSAADIERKVRKMVPQVYSLFCTASLSYLSCAGFIDEAQASVGEMLGLIPIFSMEEGKLSPLEKARNQRGVLEFFTEFLGEFDNLQHIAFLQGASPFNHETHLLREHAQLHFTRTPFSEHPISVPVASLLGPRTLGLILLEAD
jgi:DegV family protein with EDD domain